VFWSGNWRAKRLILLEANFWSAENARKIWCGKYAFLWIKGLAIKA
jgi:hypothetical protein